MEASVQEQLIAGRYRLIRPLSAGGMGQVYRAVDTQLFDRPVAVKILHQHIGGDEETLNTLKRRFEVEAQISALLGEHPHIVTVLDYGVEEHSPYLVLELLSGCSLADLLIKEGALAPERVVTLGRQMCGAFHHAHQFEVALGDRMIMGVIHRDIKPSNLFVLKDKTQQESIKVLDFGIAKVISDVSMALGTQTGSFLGTLRYASPEQLDGESLTIQSDIYSIGIVLYQMLTGAMPIRPATDTFPGWYRAHHEQQPRPPQEISSFHQIPIPLAAAVMSCLAKDPRQRPQSMHVLERALADSLTHSGASIPVASAAPEASPPAPVSSATDRAPSRTHRLSGPTSHSQPRYPAWLPWMGWGSFAGLAVAFLLSLIRTLSPSPPQPQTQTTPRPAATPIRPTPASTPVAPSPTAPLLPASPTPINTTPAVSTPDSFGCRVDYSVRTAWDQGFVLDLWVTALGSSVSDWQLSWRFPSDQVRIVNFWKGTLNQQGATVQVSPLSYNTTIPQGDRIDMGFEARHPGGLALPEQIQLNEVSCQLVQQSPPPATPTPAPAVTPTAPPENTIRIQVDRDGVQIDGVDERLERRLEEFRERTGVPPGELLRRLGQ